MTHRLWVINFDSWITISFIFDGLDESKFSSGADFRDIFVGSNNFEKWTTISFCHFHSGIHHLKRDLDSEIYGPNRLVPGPNWCKQNLKHRNGPMPIKISVRSGAWLVRSNKKMKISDKFGSVWSLDPWFFRWRQNSNLLCQQYPDHVWCSLLTATLICKSYHLFSFQNPYSLTLAWVHQAVVRLVSISLALVSLPMEMFLFFQHGLQRFPRHRWLSQL